METADAEHIARQVVTAARRRAPSFVLLNTVATAEMDSRGLIGDDREQVIAAARHLISDGL